MLRNTKRTLVEPKIAFARALRKDLTPGEKVLWQNIRRKKFHGLKFRRQVPIGPYIVDFLCVEKKLIIEIDGDSHYEPGAQERDRKREVYLRKQGFAVLRFGNTQTVQEIDMVIEKRGECLGVTETEPLPLTPSLLGGGRPPAFFPHILVMIRNDLLARSPQQ